MERLPVEHLFNGATGDVIRELQNLQFRINDGNGSQTVRSILIRLHNDDLDGARTVIQTDFDKLRQWPEVILALKRHGLVGVEEY